VFEWLAHCLQRLTMTNAGGCQTNRDDRARLRRSHRHASELRSYRGADSTGRASHGSRIVALGPLTTVATTLPPSVMLRLKTGNCPFPKKVASTFPSGLSNRINVGARALIMNPVVVSSTSAV